MQCLDKVLSFYAVHNTIGLRVRLVRVGRESMSAGRDTRNSRS